MFKICRFIAFVFIYITTSTTLAAFTQTDRTEILTIIQNYTNAWINM